LHRGRWEELDPALVRRWCAELGIAAKGPSKPGGRGDGPDHKRARPQAPREIDPMMPTGALGNAPAARGPRRPRPAGNGNAYGKGNGNGPRPVANAQDGAPRGKGRGNGPRQGANGDVPKGRIDPLMTALGGFAQPGRSAKPGRPQFAKPRPAGPGAGPGAGPRRRRPG
jgi:hypothetical protein